MVSRLFPRRRRHIILDLVIVAAVAVAAGHVAATGAAGREGQPDRRSRDCGLGASSARAPAPVS
jgi:hypothetical protein